MDHWRTVPGVSKAVKQKDIRYLDIYEVRPWPERMSTHEGRGEEIACALGVLIFPKAGLSVPAPQTLALLCAG